MKNLHRTNPLLKIALLALTAALPQFSNAAEPPLEVLHCLWKDSFHRDNLNFRHVALDIDLVEGRYVISEVARGSCRGGYGDCQPGPGQFGQLIWRFTGKATVKGNRVSLTRTSGDQHGGGRVEREYLQVERSTPGGGYPSFTTSVEAPDNYFGPTFQRYAANPEFSCSHIVSHSPQK